MVDEPQQGDTQNEGILSSVYSDVSHRAEALATTIGTIYNTWKNSDVDKATQQHLNDIKASITADERANMSNSAALREGFQKRYSAPFQLDELDLDKEIRPILQQDPIAAQGYKPSKLVAEDFSQVKDGDHKVGVFGDYHPFSDTMRLNTDPNYLMPGHFQDTVLHESRHRAIAWNDSARQIIHNLLDTTKRSFGEESVVRIGDFHHGKGYAIGAAVDHLINQGQGSPPGSLGKTEGAWRAIESLMYPRGLRADPNYVMPGGEPSPIQQNGPPIPKSKPNLASN